MGEPRGDRVRHGFRTRRGSRFVLVFYGVVFLHLGCGLAGADIVSQIVGHTDKYPIIRINADGGSLPWHAQVLRRIVDPQYSRSNADGKQAWVPIANGISCHCMGGRDSTLG